jgi:hypothetical protein
MLDFQKRFFLHFQHSRELMGLFVGCLWEGAKLSYRVLRSIGRAVVTIGLSVSTGNASTLNLSDASSDLTPASTLDATLDFQVFGGNQLQLTLTNNTSGADEFNVNAVYWNSLSVVSGLSLVSATHSVTGDVMGAWTPVLTNQIANGFSTFDFALDDGIGSMNPNIIMPGNSITFLMNISGTCAGSTNCLDTDFIAMNGDGYFAAAKFVNGPDDPQAAGFEDSAFGATAIPEPSTALLVGLGLACLSGRSARRRTG